MLLLRLGKRDTEFKTFRRQTVYNKSNVHPAIMQFDYE